MDIRIKGDLLKKLIDSHSATRVLLEGDNLELRVYTDTDWRIRDILGHIATWDRQVAKSLRAFNAGTEYSIPDFDDENKYNEQAVLEQRQLSIDQLSVECEQACEDFQEALRDMPSDRFPGDLLYPWGDERGSIPQLIDYMIDHDGEHRDEIVKAMQASAEK
jgi:hypothetical protein